MKVGKTKMLSGIVDNQQTLDCKRTEKSDDWVNICMATINVNIAENKNPVNRVTCHSKFRRPEACPLFLVHFKIALILK